jgi:hypothetical protein
LRIRDVRLRQTQIPLDGARDALILPIQSQFGQDCQDEMRGGRHGVLDAGAFAPVQPVAIGCILAKSSQPAAVGDLGFGLLDLRVVGSNVQQLGQCAIAHRRVVFFQQPIQHI